ncbi:hypothetical protein H632_c4p4 [Helicosporidium sp. ATCC 50920]|nr:hypothetical protein H632_c4p4 [Helicosporidium sp. ATCC 50920]|eukprot:KDD77174.1 hypothetical protein H632_c4p4 [Helicosporidium sp. ATCC 50920]
MSAAPAPGFFVSEAELASSPSRQDGVSAADEERLLLYGCSLIARSAVALGVPQAVAVTAQSLLRRFFSRRSLARFDVRVAAAAVCWLAAKLEEVVDIDASEDERLSLRDVLVVFHRVVHRLEAEAFGREGGATGEPASSKESAACLPASGRKDAVSLPASSKPKATSDAPAASATPKLPVLDPYSAPYAEFKALVVRVERHVLRALGFQTDVEAPHRCVLQYGAMALGLDARAQQLAWNVASDAARSRLCLLHSPGTVAAGVLFYVARRFLKQPLPARPHWWLPLGVQTAEVCAVAAQLHALYAQPAPRFVAVGRGPEPTALQTLQGRA